MTDKTLITAALIYANGPVHLGHLVEYIETDIYTRFLKFSGHDAIYCCADDTHGTPIEISALKAGVTSEEFIKTWYDQHVKDFSDFLIHFDSYYTTHSKENEAFTRTIFKALKDNGHIYKKTLRQLYCDKCKRFLPDRFVKGTCPKCGAQDQYGDVCEACGSTYKPIDLKSPFCGICKSTPVMKDSEQYFFRLGDFSERLRAWLNDNKALQSDIKNYVLSWIDKGLEDWCVSRDAPYFGFKIPGEEDKYFYVWLDAPIGYIASTENYCKDHKCSAEGAYWKSKNSQIIHFIGKDIAYFHLIFWPAVLMGSGFKTPDNVVVHGFLTVNGEKMSKSRGTFITAREYLQILDPEFLRYHYASNLTHTTGDIDLSFEDFKNRANNELIGNIANFCYRTLSFIDKYAEGKIGKTGARNADLMALERADDLVRKAEKNYHGFALREAVKNALEISNVGNRYFQENAPWKLAKEDPVRMAEVLAIAANLVKKLAITLNPILPIFSEKIFKSLNLKDVKWDDFRETLENHKVHKPEILFQKIERVEFSDAFSTLDLRVAKVEKVDDIADSEKLYVLSIDLGDEKRTLVAGLKDKYSKSDLKGKHIVVVCNLKKANLKGVESEGMLLAADDGKDVGVLFSKDKPGTHVVIDGVEKRPAKELTIKDFAKFELVAKDGKAYYKDRTLRTGEGDVQVDKKIEGKVK
ncbi:MAG: methionine--tRNA ligase [Candidatus Aenigmatarchaeota archaeon]